MSVYVIRAFIEQREKLADNAAILKRLAAIDRLPASRLRIQAAEQPRAELKLGW